MKILTFVTALAAIAFASTALAQEADPRFPRANNDIATITLGGPTPEWARALDAAEIIRLAGIGVQAQAPEVQVRRFSLEPNGREDVRYSIYLISAADYYVVSELADGYGMCTVPKIELKAVREGDGSIHSSIESLGFGYRIIPDTGDDAGAKCKIAAGPNAYFSASSRMAAESAIRIIDEIHNQLRSDRTGYRRFFAIACGDEDLCDDPEKGLLTLMDRYPIGRVAAGGCSESDPATCYFIDFGVHRLIVRTVRMYDQDILDTVKLQFLQGGVPEPYDKSEQELEFRP